MASSAAIYGCQGLELTAEERSFFAETRPLGFILFARNCSSPSQVRALCDALRGCIGDGQAPILIDQEGGRVARLTPPHWRARPPARRFGDVYEADAERGREAAYLCARLIAHDLHTVGVNVNCTPVLDVPVPGSHDIIGDRAYSLSPTTVIALGRATIDGHLDGGVLPIIKHIPGHGRAQADSHVALPRVTASKAELSQHDFVTFRGLSHAPIAMTAHVVYESIDANRPATTSPRVVRTIMRGEIGFNGLLLSDDLSMAALEGALDARAKAAMLAGCDVVLHCNGKMDEMRRIASVIGPLGGASLRRATAARAQLRNPSALDFERAEARMNELLQGAGV